MPKSAPTRTRAASAAKARRGRSTHAIKLPSQAGESADLSASRSAMRRQTLSRKRGGRAGATRDSRRRELSFASSGWGLFVFIGTKDGGVFPPPARCLFYLVNATEQHAI